MSEQRKAAVDENKKCEVCWTYGVPLTRVRTTNGGLLWCEQCRSDINRKNPQVVELTATVAKLQADLDSIYAMATHLKVCKTRDAAAVVGGLSRWHAEFGAIQDTLDGSQAEVAKLQAENERLQHSHKDLYGALRLYRKIADDAGCPKGASPYGFLADELTRLKCSSCGMPAGAGRETNCSNEFHALVSKWREQANGNFVGDCCGQVAVYNLNQCADELEAALRATSEHDKPTIDDIHDSLSLNGMGGK